MKKLLSREQLLPMKGLSTHTDPQNSKIAEDLYSVVNNLVALESLNPAHISNKFHSKIDNLINHSILVTPSRPIEPLIASKMHSPAKTSIEHTTQEAGYEPTIRKAYYKEHKGKSVGECKRLQTVEGRSKKRKRGKLNICEG